MTICTALREGAAELIATTSTGAVWNGKGHAVSFQANDYSPFYTPTMSLNRRRKVRGRTMTIVQSIFMHHQRGLTDDIDLVNRATADAVDWFDGSQRTFKAAPDMDYHRIYRVLAGHVTKTVTESLGA